MLQFLFVIVLIIVALYGLYEHFTKPDTLLEKAHQMIGELQTQLKFSQDSQQASSKEFVQLKDKFEKLRFNKISADVKLGQKYENILPFLAEFPYPEADVRGLFNPLDLIVFTDDEVVFMEVKTGAAQLSDKQRRIRDNIKAGRVRFEVLRMNEKGVTVK